ncbi:hypothetical protein [Leifsonia sp. 71-9]|uniref:hypothetical protein n=1 Tax=Leifsonia sp. 71-9 TaxID=1895934 RepID=UPI0025BABFEA|nr:hypothetical protein [Leifsonia sp. 71-9]
MNAAETIATAIEKLDHLKANSTPGPWREEDHEEEFVGFMNLAHAILGEVS